MTEDGNTFHIDPISGVITLAAGEALDYEVKRYYFVTVVVKDMKSGAARGGEASFTFTINVLDANDAPTILNGLILPMKENSLTGTRTTKSFTASDTDITALGALTYEVVSQTDPSGAAIAANETIFDLAVVGVAKDVFAEVVMPRAVLLDRGGFDYEACLKASACTFQLRVKVTDGGIADPTGKCGLHCAAKSVTALVAVTIVDVNEPPSLVTVRVAVEENKDANTGIIQLVATDPEPKDVSSLLFVVENTRLLSPGTNDCAPPYGAPTSNWVAVTGDGILKSATPMNYEAFGPDYAFCVEIKVRGKEHRRREEREEQHMVGCVIRVYVCGCVRLCTALYGCVYRARSKHPFPPLPCSITRRCRTPGG